MTTFHHNTPETTESAGNIYVRQDGPRDAPALVLVHGSAASSRSWDTVVGLLTRSHHVIRVDLLGHGRSPKPDDADYATTTQARRLGTVLDRLNVPHAVVTGHSSGGYTATALAKQRPDLVTALALINTGPSLEAFIAPESAGFELAQWPPSDEQLRVLASSGFGVSAERIPQEMLDDVRAMTYHSFVATMRASTAYLEQHAMPWRLTTLGKPVLVVFGADDRRWQPTVAIAQYRAVPGTTVEVLPGIGHSPIVDAPSHTATLLLEFAAQYG